MIEKRNFYAIYVKNYLRFQLISTISSGKKYLRVSKKILRFLTYIIFISLETSIIIFNLYNPILFLN